MKEKVVLAYSGGLDLSLIHIFFANDKSADRNAAAQSLCRCHYIRQDSVVLIGKHLSGPAHAALDFIQNQKHIFFITDFPDFLNKFFFPRINAAFTLNGFKKNRTGFVRDL